MIDNNPVLEEHTCLICGQKTRIVVLENNDKLSDKYRKLITDSGTKIIKKGQYLVCPNCKNTVKVE